LNKTCIICGYKYHAIGDINFSYWKDISKSNLERIYKSFKYGKCKGCGYERIIVNYSDDLFRILYPNNFVSTAISETRSINEDIFNWTSEFIEDRNVRMVADIGCGKLTFLQKLQQKYPKKDWSLYGIDHRVQSQETTHQINFIEVDLLQMNNSEILKPLKFDFAYCIHTLEHIQNPRDALLAIKERLKEGAHLYLEVPANEIVKELSLCSVELFHPQHISYFSLRTLELIANVCGLQVVKKEAVITDGVPRAKVVVKKMKNICKNSLIKPQVKQIDDLLSNLANKVRRKIDDGEKLALWGCGSDLDKIFSMDEKLIGFVSIKKLYIIDTFLKEKSYKNFIISAPDILLKNKEISVIIVPRLKTIRHSIKKAINDLDIDKDRIVDPYDVFDKFKNK